MKKPYHYFVSLHRARAGVSRAHTLLLAPLPRVPVCAECCCPFSFSPLSHSPPLWFYEVTRNAPPTPSAAATFREQPPPSRPAAQRVEHYTSPPSGSQAPARGHACMASAPRRAPPPARMPGAAHSHETHGPPRARGAAACPRPPSRRAAPKNKPLAHPLNAPAPAPRMVAGRPGILPILNPLLFCTAPCQRVISRQGPANLFSPRRSAPPPSVAAPHRLPLAAAAGARCAAHAAHAVRRTLRMLRAAGGGWVHPACMKMSRAHIHTASSGSPAQALLTRPFADCSPSTALNTSRSRPSCTQFD